MLMEATGGAVNGHRGARQRNGKLSFSANSAESFTNKCRFNYFRSDVGRLVCLDPHCIRTRYSAKFS